MVSQDKAFEEFVDSIPDEKLEKFPVINNTRVWPKKEERGQNFRLDMQGMTTGSKAHNLQIQANKGAKCTSVAKTAKKSNTTVSTVIVPVDNTATAEEVRDAFREAYKKTDGKVELGAEKKDT